MGENILKGQVEAFKRCVNKAKEDLLTPDLFAIPELYDVEYTVEPVGTNFVKEGECLFGYTSEDGTEVLLAMENRVVGKIRGDGASEIISSINEAGSFGFVPMTVSSVYEFSNFYTVRNKGLERQ